MRRRVSEGELNEGAMAETNRRIADVEFVWLSGGVVRSLREEMFCFLRKK